MYCRIESPLKCQNLNTVQAEYRKFSINPPRVGGASLFEAHLRRGGAYLRTRIQSGKAQVQGD